MFDAVSIATNQTSNPTSLIRVDRAHILIEWSGAAVGNLKVQARHHSMSNPGSWFDLSGLDIIPISGGPGTHEILFNTISFEEIRLVYTASSSTGSLTATIEAKVEGN